MQNLRRLIAVIFAVWAGALLAAAPLRITTWNLHWFPSGVANLKVPEIEAERISAAASVLKDLRPDIILLQEVRDEESVHKLLESLAPNTYKVVIVSRFEERGTIGWQQVAIASKMTASAAYARRWQTLGVVDPPRGFAFALFDIDGTTLAVYAVHLKSNLVRGDATRQNQLNILKRELSAEQILAHLKTVQVELGITVDCIIVGGDFNTGPDDLRFVSEGTLPTFHRAGFDNSLLKFTREHRITIPASGRYPAATFDHILVFGGSNEPIAEVHKSNVSDHYPVTVEITLNKAKN